MSLSTTKISIFTTSLVSTFLISTLLFQAIFPSIAYAMEETIASEASSTKPELMVNSPAVDELTSSSSPIIPTGDIPTGTSSIETSYAVSGLTIENEVNTTNINTLASSSSSTAATSTDSTASSTASTTALLPDNTEMTIPAFGFEPTAEASTTNSATTTNDAASSANTGSNRAYANKVDITTGDAVAYVDITNVVNTTITNSDGLVKFINDTLGQKNFDLRPDTNLIYADFNTAQSTSNCTTGSCGSGSQLTSNTNNTANIDNTVTVVADTGNNSAIGNDTSITTGDAYAAANIINVANTNIIDSHYLLLVFNNFSDYAGDIVLPNSSFFDKFLASGQSNSPTSIDSNNSASVNNAVNTVADTGNNSAAGNNTNITTGSSYASSDTSNTINQNIIDNNSFTMLIRVQGDWTGTISGLPDGMTWRQTDRGIEIVSDRSASRLITSAGTISTTNQAKINNDVQVFALTGDNQAGGDGATIKTGNAHADSSIMNIVNSNIIGSNWMNLIFTIYGNWNGNLAFGQPDLWLGVRAKSVDQPIMSNSAVDYTFTVLNHGDTKAHQVNLESLFEGSALSFSGQTSGHSNWNLGDIPAGETREITYRAVVSPLLNNSVVSAIPLTARVTSAEHDANNADNQDIATIYAGVKRSHSASNSTTFPAHFDISKTADKSVTQNGDIVNYTVTFFNRGGQLYDALLVDNLTNEAGDNMLTQSWPLGEIKNWETITITYAIRFDDKFSPGVYTNTAQLVGFQGSRIDKKQTPYESTIAKHTVRHALDPAGQVLGISTSSCSPYLTDYMRVGQSNNSAEVTKLQVFLNNHMSSNLPITGFFGNLTARAVQTFQNQYSNDILSPWNLTNGTGFVYYTTQKKINELACEGTREFPLSTIQQAEINRWQVLSSL
ncbi:MAG: hypothetical protein RLZZ230_830 [Candidatus Parcubacteria bacterium]|jgi:hypothetical protein